MYKRNNRKEYIKERKGKNIRQVKYIKLVSNLACRVQLHFLSVTCLLFFFSFFFSFGYNYMIAVSKHSNQ